MNHACTKQSESSRCDTYLSAAERAGIRGFRVVRESRRQGPFVAEFERVDRSNADRRRGGYREIDTVDDFLTAIESKNPGDWVLIAIERQGHRLDVPLTLENERIIS